MSKTKTHEEYVAELKTSNPDIEVIGQYSGANTSILHRCKIHDYEWMVCPANMLHKNGCPKCNKRYKRTHEDYVREVKEINPNIEVIGKYINAKIKIKHKCLVCNNTWECLPCNILSGHGCKKCSSRNTGEKLTKTHSEYVDDLYLVNPNIEVVEEYQNSIVKILHRCKVDGYEWLAKPQNILSGKGCPKCSKRYKRTIDEYTKELSIVSPSIELIGGYKNITTKAIYKCKICNHVWSTIPEVTLRGCGCPICGNKIISEKLSKTHEQYIAELSSKNPNVEVLEIYKGANTPIKHRCKIDNCEWNVAPAHLLYTTGCPKCASSKGEAKVREWLELRNIKYEEQKKFKDCKDKRALPFDFYLPDLNICIEYDGEQHFRPVTFNGTDVSISERNFERTKKHDRMKNKYCEDNGIGLIRISYNENVEEKLDLLLA